MHPSTTRCRVQKVLVCQLRSSCTGLHRLSEEHWSRLHVLGFDVVRLRSVAEEQKGESADIEKVTGHRCPKATAKSGLRWMTGAAQGGESALHVRGFRRQ
eukprot:1542669-Amphidinium_carterae.3